MIPNRYNLACAFPPGLFFRIAGRGIQQTRTRIYLIASSQHDRLRDDPVSDRVRPAYLPPSNWVPVNSRFLLDLTLRIPDDSPLLNQPSVKRRFPQSAARECRLSLSLRRSVPRHARSPSSRRSRPCRGKRSKPSRKPARSVSEILLPGVLRLIPLTRSRCQRRSRRALNCALDAFLSPPANAKARFCQSKLRGTG